MGLAQKGAPVPGWQTHGLVSILGRRAGVRPCNRCASLRRCREGRFCPARWALAAITG
ncbi:hypothetical protein ABI_17400 [Asticcacaulis biprosthecium C19]|uniref:Uncharacterized protein n=1 Tax=Asticcacaulis biprosthecium C19 TaxID=715226 RepID=F4QKC3_9CAUL|nr:hypothetical protein ABI_17400 [Asticcacaulis biprosthecium C19]